LGICNRLKRATIGYSGKMDRVKIWVKMIAQGLGIIKLGHSHWESLSIVVIYFIKENFKDEIYLGGRM